MEKEEDLLKLAREDNIEAKNILYEKYKYIAQILVRKNQSFALSLGIDINELEQEAYIAFSDALNNYRDDKNAKFSTFLTLCIDRRIKKIIKKYSGEKAKLLNNTYSLDYDYNEEGTTLKDMISDERENDPLYKLTLKENYNELLDKITKSLSKTELEVFNYCVNGFDYLTIAELTDKNAKQIDNTIQRLKHKIRDIIGE